MARTSIIPAAARLLSGPYGAIEGELDSTAQAASSPALCAREEAIAVTMCESRSL